MFSFIVILVFPFLKLKIGSNSDADGDHFRRPFWWSTLFWLTYRLMLATAREPAVIILRMGQKIVIQSVIFVLLLES